MRHKFVRSWHPVNCSSILFATKLLHFGLESFIGRYTVIKSGGDAQKPESLAALEFKSGELEPSALIKVYAYVHRSINMF